MEISIILKKLAAVSKSVRKDLEVWNLYDIEKQNRKIQECIQQLHGQSDNLNNQIQEVRKRLYQPKYAVDLENAMREKKLPIQGEFPSYTLGSCQLEFRKSTETMTLRYGDDVHEFPILEPTTIADEIRSFYDGIVNKPFNARYFAQDLLSAYEMANQAIYRKGKIQWGRVVSLKKIYHLLTIRRSSRKEYPEPQFVYELSRFRQSEMILNNYLFELSPPRDVSTAYVLQDLETGREVRVSGLTIYEKHEDASHTKRLILP